LTWIRVDYCFVKIEKHINVLLLQIPNAVIFCKPQCFLHHLLLAVHSYLRMSKKHRRYHPSLLLEVLSENHMTPTLMSSLQTVCPKLRELRVLWYVGYIVNILDVLACSTFFSSHSVIVNFTTESFKINKVYRWRFSVQTFNNTIIYSLRLVVSCVRE
jgi:hypothetical protein